MHASQEYSAMQTGKEDHILNNWYKVKALLLKT